MDINTPSPQQENCDKVAEGMRDSFGQLAQAAVAKLDTTDAHAATIAALSKIITDMTATNAIMVGALASKGTRAVPPPPGFAPTGTVTADTTGHAVDSAGMTCPTNKFRGRTSFVVPQHCTIYNKADHWHLPQNCIEAPHNAVIKVKILAKRAADKVVKAAQTVASN
jgi:hypothetical protein